MDTMETKQTAVEWLVRMLYSPVCRGFINGRREMPFDIIRQAKQMEKEQMKDAFVECWLSNVPDGIECKLDAEQYYNETYGKQDKQTN